MAFTNRLRSGKFLFSVYKNYSNTTKYLNADDAIIAREIRSKKREKHNDPHPDKGRKVARIVDRRDE